MMSLRCYAGLMVSVETTSCKESECTLMDKAVRYVSKFPCIPAGSNIQRRIATIGEAWDMHRALVAAFNSWSCIFSERDPHGTYITLIPIK